MKERGIIFSAPMVLAILAGQKTQTRRVAPSQQAIKTWPPPSPYGEVGDLLWVREPLFRADLFERNPEPSVYYAADNTPLYSRDPKLKKWGGRGRVRWPWKVKTLPSRYCPRWASRITLEIISVRLEKLQAITEEDAEAEGVHCAPGILTPIQPNCRRAFEHLWGTINGKRAPWASDPWVWAITFRVWRATT